jgi:hypothetical protein
MIALAGDPQGFRARAIRELPFYRSTPPTGADVLRLS